MRDKKRTVFVLGAGRIRLTTVRDLIASGFMERVVIGDVDISRAEKLTGVLESNNIEAK